MISDTQQHRKQAINQYIAAYNGFDVEGMLEDLSEDVVFENTSNGTITLRTEGKAAFREQAAAASKYFRERKQTITSWNFDGPKVTTSIAYRAVVAIDLPNGLSAGDHLQLDGTSEFIFAEGRIIRITDIS